MNPVYTTTYLGRGLLLSLMFVLCNRIMNYGQMHLHTTYSRSVHCTKLVPTYFCSYMLLESVLYVSIHSVYFTSQHVTDGLNRTSEPRPSLNRNRTHILAASPPQPLLCATLSRDSKHLASRHNLRTRDN